MPAQEFEFHILTLATVPRVSRPRSNMNSTPCLLLLFLGFYEDEFDFHILTHF